MSKMIKSITFFKCIKIIIIYLIKTNFYIYEKKNINTNGENLKSKYQLVK